MIRGARRYLGPLAALPRTRFVLARVGRSLAASARRADTAALPAALAIDVVDAPAGVMLGLADFRRVYDAVRPAHLTLTGNGDPLANPHLAAMVAHAAAAGSTVRLDTPGRLLRAGPAYALLQAGLAELRAVLDHADAVAVGNLQRLVAMRDANRKPGPRIEVLLALPAGVGALQPLLDLCHARLPGVEPMVRLSARAWGTGGARAAVPELRAARARAVVLGFPRTITSIDRTLAQITIGPGKGPCHVPWYAAHVSTSGALSPCVEDSRGGGRLGNSVFSDFLVLWNALPMRTFRKQTRRDRSGGDVCQSCFHEDIPMAEFIGALGIVGGPRAAGRCG